ncbi:hypothetical protein NLI96_g6297 [Meripilus lineatus]|uniref:Glutathione S-transferase n=1 Tax=Meripilus lineatus TaxID=2056292 RepID=A0AAD5V1B8_9APHY|nr:hypothetical protein NLI96_g6297 [Physisporinus lineatus]
MSHGKQFTLYSHVGGPNGWKPALIMEELGLTYETVYFNFQAGEQKGPEHLKLNPNGRIPTIVDHHNNDFAVCPYFGQYFWFTMYHSEKIPSAIERYKNEILRVFGVLEGVLSKQQWLVGDKYTIADLSFITWNNGVIKAFKNSDPEWSLADKFPAVANWNERINARPAVAKVLGHRAELMAAKQ